MSFTEIDWFSYALGIASPMLAFSLKEFYFKINNRHKLEITFSPEYYVEGPYDAENIRKFLGFSWCVTNTSNKKITINSIWFTDKESQEGSEVYKCELVTLDSQEAISGNVSLNDIYSGYLPSKTNYTQGAYIEAITSTNKKFKSKTINYP